MNQINFEAGKKAIDCISKLLKTNPSGIQTGLLKAALRNQRLFVDSVREAYTQLHDEFQELKGIVHESNSKSSD